MRTSALTILCVSGALIACDSLERRPTPTPPAAAVNTDLFSGGGVGAECTAEAVCRDGLRCANGVCEPSGARELNEPCILTEECSGQLICGWAGFCSEAGERQESEPCAHDGDCARGYFCNRVGGIAGECAELVTEGADVGEPCDGSGVCAPGLICSPDRDEPICLPGSLLLNPDIFRGVACDEAGEAEMDFGMRHTLPNAGADFFSTPFPSDLRITSGRVDLRDYPRPGAGLNQADLFGNLLTDVSDLRSGWSRNPGIYLRFTRPLHPDYQLAEDETTRRGLDLNDDIKLIELDEDSYREWPADIRYHPERNKYICAHHVFVHPKWSKPLTPGKSYAVVVLNTLRSADDERPRPLDATAELISNVTPRDPVEREAWQRYAPLRIWIKDNPSVGNKIVGATVFTVSPESGLMQKAREAVYEQAQVRFDPQHEPVVCGMGVRSPCASTDEELSRLAERGLDGPDPRGCPAEPNPAYHEIHAKVLLPLFQRGTPPYTLSGGEVITDDGKPRFNKFTSVCMAITVPRDLEPPESGWPVVLYGHGTGGSFRAGVKLLGGLLSKMRADASEDTPDMPGEPQGSVLIAIDQVMHGTRLGEDTLLASGPLFFNIQNPTAARGNLIQGALDNFALTRMITQDSDLHEWNFPEIGTLNLNREHIAYHGHSQGGTTGPIFAPFEEKLNGVVFSGTAGGIMFSLTDKKEPYDATLGLQLALQEFNLTDDHPAIHIFQEYFDDVDPLNYAEKLFSNPSGNRLHMLHIFGLQDTFTPDRGQISFAGASGAEVATPHPLEDDPSSLDGLDDLSSEGYSVSGNYKDIFTTVVTIHAPEDDSGSMYNGHFVAYQNPSARSQLLRFLRDLGLGEIPEVRE